MMQYESSMHELCCNKSEKHRYLLLYKIFMHFTLAIMI
jgi:hypothetical protein